MTDLSDYAFAQLRDGDPVLYRGSGEGLAPILRVVPASESASESLNEAAVFRFTLPIGSETDA